MKSVFKALLLLSVGLGIGCITGTRSTVDREGSIVRAISSYHVDEERGYAFRSFQDPQSNHQDEDSIQMTSEQTEVDVCALGLVRCEELPLR